MKLKYLILSLVFLIFLISACAPRTITVTKYQCQNGEVVDSIELCEEQQCPTCPEEKICPPLPEKVCETIQQPYVEKVSYEYALMYGVTSDSTSGTFLDINNYGTEQKTIIKNFDDVKGSFTVKHHYRTLKKEGTKEVSHEIGSDETKEFVTTFDTALGEDVEVNTEIIPPTETRFREIIKYKEVELCTCKIKQIK